MSSAARHLLAIGTAVVLIFAVFQVGYSFGSRRSEVPEDIQIAHDSEIRPPHAIPLSVAASAGRVPVFADPFGTDAAKNLSGFRDGLYAAVVKDFEGWNRTRVSHGEYALFKEVVRCPPNRPHKRYGGFGDGGKILCRMPDAAAAGCTVLSLGSRNDFTFETGMLDATGCDVVTMDCSHDAQSLGPRHQFHRVCVGTPAGATKLDASLFLPYDEAVAKYVRSKIAVLKIDIEGFETQLLSSLRPGFPNLPEQIALEIHLLGDRSKKHGFGWPLRRVQLSPGRGRKWWRYRSIMI
ncbi:methyltransferase domain-containing protein [Hyaloraphidium curvatum]|nr:methyltransferase domain-containing protein [Hyaloraphidium curvatum]